ncbi:hypothetical protein OU995_05890 [Roseateles sp. SL47]|uniref:hypothetical protein n=1 Tax=Roseateles sp. SL47 TaxID=2995138 RepID=UPI002271B43E|nr:hypothetical protein [Roseateles sp. SL47]WAC74255.1 hypothetical protein OU995_05890 [Roseateles sp. SL47]
MSRSPLRKALQRRQHHQDHPTSTERGASRGMPGSTAQQVVQSMADHSGQTRLIQRLQSLADQARPPVAHATQDTAPVQRMRVSDTSTFEGEPRDPTNFPVHYAQAVLSHLAEHPITIHGTDTAKLWLSIPYSATKTSKWIEVSNEDIEIMQSMVQSLSPNARKEAATDALYRGDDTGDVNPSAYAGNCGYCVLARLLGAESADQVCKAMAQANLGSGMDNAGTTPEQLRLALHKANRVVGDLFVNLSKQALKEGILKTPDHQHMTFVVRFPAHFVLATVVHDGILIEDPQTKDHFDFDALPDTDFMVFLVRDP